MTKTKTMEPLSLTKKVLSNSQFTDSHKRKLLLLLVSLTFLISIASAATTPSKDGTLSWKGLNWCVTSGNNMGSAQNNWSNSGKNIWIDEKDRLHLTIKRDRGTWNCTQLATERGYKYGKFTWKIESPVFTLDKNSVLGLFLYADDDHEIDIEVSRWKEDQNNLLRFTNQPYYIPENVISRIPSITTNGVTTAESGYNGSNITLQIDWQPTYIDWTAYDDKGNFLTNAHYINVEGIPNVEQRLMMNLWLKQKPASDGQDIEIIISDVHVDETRAYPKAAEVCQLLGISLMIECIKTLHSYWFKLFN